MIKKYSFLVLACCLLSSFAYSQQDSLMLDKDKVTFSLLTHISIFESVNFGYEKQLKPMRSVETELAYIYASFFADNASGVIWRNTYKHFTRRFSDGRFFLGPQLVLHYHRVKQQAIFSHLNGAYFERDDMKRQKFRASLMGVMGREWFLGDRLMIEFNFGVGVKYDNVKFIYDNVGQFDSPVNNSNFFRREGAMVLPDGNIALKLKYNLNT